jgi:7-cyano-7-deazaguanine synthase
MNSKSAVILLSGGLDSAFNLWQGRRELEIKLALTFDYGQRAAKAEIRAARELCERCEVKHQVLHAPWFREFTKTSLVSHTQKVPVGPDVAIDDAAKSATTASAVWVPNRNGIFTNIAAAYAEGLGAGVVLVGFNKEEAQTFPDNSVQYTEALNRSLFFSTANHVEVVSYCAGLEKTEIVRQSKRLGLPLEIVWPCYFDGDRRCGRCESCQRFERALIEAGEA